MKRSFILSEDVLEVQMKVCTIQIYIKILICKFSIGNTEINKRIVLIDLCRLKG